MRLLILTIAALSVLVGVSLASAPARAQVTLPPSAVVVDDNDPNFAKFGPPQWWYTATGTPFNYYGGAMTWTGNVRSGAPVNYARWSLPLTATLPMTYEVFAFIPRYNATTTNARYQVVVSGVTTTVAISQNRYHAEWVSLGTFFFGPNGPHLVQLTDVTGEASNSRQVGFDALAFVPRPALPPLPAMAFLPIVVEGSAGALRATTSRYISTVDPAHHYAMGCAAGQADERGTVILAFGQPWVQEGVYGVIYYRRPGYPFASTQVIAEAAKGFLRGYWECAPPDATLKVAIGTNNYRGATQQLDTSRAHGQAWGQMIGQLHAWLQAEAPPDVQDRLAVFGGNDIEMSWNTPALTKAWVEGYVQATSRPFINFGTCDGCPTTGNPTRQPNNGWTVEDVWQVNGPAYVIPFPEIYLRNGVNADQWYRMSLYGALNKGSKLNFGGLLTQWQACQDRGTCGGLTDNTPQQGWEQLQSALNADPRTAMPLPPPSDITWQNITTTNGMNNQMAGAFSPLADVVRQPMGQGVIVEGVLPPLSAMHFLAENAWEDAQVIVFAGLVRDPASGGDDTQARGGVVVFTLDEAGAYIFPPRLLPAPILTGALRVVQAEGGILTLSDGATLLRFDVAARAWIE